MTTKAMNSVQKISVSEKAKNFLISREAAVSLFASLSPIANQQIEFDFEHVEFMSRSYADQFHKEKISFEQKHNVKIRIVNANEEIIYMLRVVALTQSADDRKFEQIPVFKFSQTQMLSDYLLSI
ncbi:MAG TPA: hypothetical protein VJI69_04565 [Bacteroidia bacterium]|nr:hypothetical protein [Bacteroidia bacterium]